MASKEEVLRQLIEMSHWLGEESRGLAILGEGNTSARITDDTFYVKASGTQLSTIAAEGFVEVHAPKVLAMLEGPALSDEEIKQTLRSAMVEPSGEYLPSIETLFHAYLLSLPGVSFIGHTHPVSVSGILCSKGWREVTRQRVFPDEIVCCGPRPAYVKYVDPGVPLARAIRDSVKQFIDEESERPRAILMQNHGLIALGSTPKEVQGVSAMWDKTAKILAATFRFGGPNYLSDAHVSRIHTRPDEEQRKKLIDGH